MEQIADNEIVLVGKLMPSIQHISFKNQKAYRLKIKIDDKYLSNTIPIIVINPNEDQFKNYKNKEIAIIGHVEAKWSINIIVDAYKINEEIMLKI